MLDRCKDFNYGVRSISFILRSLELHHPLEHCLHPLEHRLHPLKHCLHPLEHCFHLSFDLGRSKKLDSLNNCITAKFILNSKYTGPLVSKSFIQLVHRMSETRLLKISL